MPGTFGNYHGSGTLLKESFDSSSHDKGMGIDMGQRLVWLNQIRL
jgi:hypothetical protein